MGWAAGCAGETAGHVWGACGCTGGFGFYWLYKGADAVISGNPFPISILLEVNNVVYKPS